MAKRTITNFAQVLRLLGTLTDGEKATLRDVLRPEPAKRATKKTSTKARAAETPPPLFTEAPKGANEETKHEICAACGNGPDFADHFQPSPVFHEFQSPKKSAKGKAAA